MFSVKESKTMFFCCSCYKSLFFFFTAHFIGVVDSVPLFINGTIQFADASAKISLVNEAPY